MTPEELARGVEKLMRSHDGKKWLRRFGAESWTDGPCSLLAFALYILDGAKGKIIVIDGGCHYVYRRGWFCIDGDGLSKWSEMRRRWEEIIGAPFTVGEEDNAAWHLDSDSIQVLNLLRRYI